MEWVLLVLALVVAANTVVAFRLIRDEVRYRRAVKRRLKTYASLHDAVIDQKR